METGVHALSESVKYYDRQRVCLTAAAGAATA